MGLVLDHLSQAPFGAVDEDGGVDAGDGVEAGTNYWFMEIAVFSESASASRRRGTQCVGGTRCDCTPTRNSQSGL